jgi:erythromycin esterase-like protein
MSHPVPKHRTLDEWIARDAIPFSLDSPAALSAAVDLLVAALGDGVELLGFGEALHGGEEILVLRNRLFQRLVEAHGYSAIAIESSFPRSRAVDEYVAGRGPASYDDVRETGFGQAFGGLEANRELVEWMRRYNADPAHRVKLHFYGFDIPTGTIGIASPRQVVQFVLDYLAALDDARALTYRERIDPLLGQDDAWENPAALADHTQSIGASPAANALRIEVEELISELRTRQPELIASGGEPRYREALHYAAVARQLLNFHAALARAGNYAERLGVRDVMLADNLAYIVARERGQGKVLAFAHNSHLKRGMAEWQLGPDLIEWWPAGAHLAALLGPRYAVIGSAVGVSEENGIGEPEAGTLEARLAAAPGPVRFIPTYRGQGSPAAEIAALPERTGSRKNPTYFALTPRSFADFDWLAILDSAIYQRGGPSLQAWDAGREE